MRKIDLAEKIASFPQTSQEDWDREFNTLCSDLLILKNIKLVGDMGQCKQNTVNGYVQKRRQWCGNDKFAIMTTEPNEFLSFTVKRWDRSDNCVESKVYSI